MLFSTTVSFLPAAVSLVASSSKIPMLETECKGGTPTLVRTILLELVAFLVIAYVACDSSVKAGSVQKGVIVAGCFFAFALALPKLIVSPTVKSLCGTCNSYGKIAVGLISLFCLGLINYLILSALMVGFIDKGDDA